MNSFPILRVRGPRAERGSTLVLALVSLFIVSTFAVTLLNSVMTEKSGISLQADRIDAVRTADGLVQVAENNLLTNVANYATLPTPTSSNGFQILNGSSSYGPGGTWTVTRATTTTGGVATIVAPQVRVDALTGLSTTVENYMMNASVRSGSSRVTMRRQIELQKTPIFQFLAFYEGDFEALPGAAMTLTGRVHSNSDMYLGAGVSLTIDSKYCKAAGVVHRRRKDDPTTAGVQTGWIKIRDSAVGGALTVLQSKGDLTSLGITSTWGLDSDFNGWDLNGDGLFGAAGEMPPFPIKTESQFHGTLEAGANGVKALLHPNIGTLGSYVATGTGTGGDYVASATPGVYTAVTAGTGTHNKGYYHKNAGLVVKNTSVYTTDGTDVTSLMPSGFVATKTMWDARENKTVTLTKIDVSKLGDMDGVVTTYDPCPYFPSNGLLYAYRTDTTSSTGSGIVLVNGSQINVPAKWDSGNYGVGKLFAGAAPLGAFAFAAAQLKGLTVVSPAPVYVQGDYNTIVAKPSSVIADAVHLLSNAWNWTNSSTSGLKVATDTTYNTAIIAGSTVTTVGHYNGGFENFPRLHEDWASKTCTIKGSFVNAWTSQIHTGAWVYGAPYYTAPTRNWSFDSAYDLGTLPPFTPMAVASRSIAWEVMN